MSFSRMSVPVAVSGTVKEIVASNGTQSVVIQSPWACAIPCPSVIPFSPIMETGKLPSKYHRPLASPCILSGLLTTSSGKGSVTRIFSFAIGTLGHGANVHSGPLRPTADPSGQSFASIVHPTGSGDCLLKTAKPTIPMRPTQTIPITMITRFFMA